MKLTAIIGFFLIDFVLGQVALAGVNIAGCDFGCLDNGQCFGGACPLTVGPKQMQHFTYQDGLTLYRIPTGWQFLVNYKLGGPLNETYMKQYDQLVKACVATSSYCIIDIHNYGRWLNESLVGGTIGQCQGPECPTNAHFVTVWSQLASRYKAYPKVVFGIMNEPHDLDIDLWAQTCQLVVNGIRKAGAKKQLILVPGSEYSHAGNFPYYSGPALLSVKDTDGTTDLIKFDIHQYYDDDGYGDSTECNTNHIEDAWKPLAQFLRSHGRQAMVTEFGGGNNAACVKYICQALDYFNANSDVYLGWVGWAAGKFPRNCKLIRSAVDHPANASPDELSEVPGPNGKDTLLVQKCVSGKYMP